MSYLVPTTQRTVTSCMAEVSAALDAIRTSLGDIDITLSGNVVSTVMGPAHADAVSNIEVASRRSAVREQFNSDGALQEMLASRVYPNVSRPGVKDDIRHIICTFAHNQMEAWISALIPRLTAAVDKARGEIAGATLTAHENATKAKQAAEATMVKWHSLQGSMASGRVAFESRREDVIDAFVERVTTMDRLFSMRTGLQQAQQKETETFTQQLARVGGNLQLITPQEMRDTTERRKVLQQQIKQVDMLITGDDVDSKSSSIDIKVPAHMESELRGQELVVNMDVMMEKNASVFQVIKGYTSRVGHDVDPVAGEFWKPPTGEDRYSEVPESFRARYVRENTRLWTLLVQAVAPGTIRELIAPFSYGVRGDKQSTVSVSDGVSLYWALLSKYRPLTDVYKNDVEDYLDKSFTMIARTSSALVGTLQKILSYISEAKLLGSRIKWHKTGAKWHAALRTKAQYSVALAPYVVCSVDSDDSVLLLEQMAQEILKVAVAELASPDTARPFQQMSMLATEAGDYTDTDSTLSYESQDWARAMQGQHDDEDRVSDRGVRVVPGNALAQARALAGKGKGRGRGAPPFRGLGAHRSYQGSKGGYSGAYGTGRGRTGQAYQAEVGHEASMLAAQLVPKGWSKENGCFNQGCPDKKFKQYDFCPTCHKTGVQTGSITCKDGRKYQMCDIKAVTEEQRRAVQDQIRKASVQFRREFANMAERLEMDDEAEMELVAAMHAELSQQDEPIQAMQATERIGKRARHAVDEVPWGHGEGDNALMANMQHLLTTESEAFGGR